MTRLLPYPLLALFLFFMWVALSESYTPGWIVLGVVIAFAGTWAMTALRLDKPRLRRPLAMLRLAGAVTVDIARSNIAVARIILQRQSRPTSGFIHIPLDLRDHNGLAVLACIITATPGSIWLNYDKASGVLLIHVLDLIDEMTWIELIKHRYERLLMEIFE